MRRRSVGRTSPWYRSIPGASATSTRHDTDLPQEARRRADAVPLHRKRGQPGLSRGIPSRRTSPRARCLRAGRRRQAFKYPGIFSSVQAVVLNKVDLSPTLISAWTGSWKVSVRSIPSAYLPGFMPKRGRTGGWIEWLKKFSYPETPRCSGRRPGRGVSPLRLPPREGTRAQGLGDQHEQRRGDRGRRTASGPARPFHLRWNMRLLLWHG